MLGHLDGQIQPLTWKVPNFDVSPRLPTLFSIQGSNRMEIDGI